jgi:hypothetical protein
MPIMKFGQSTACKSTAETAPYGLLFTERGEKSLDTCLKNATKAEKTGVVQRQRDSRYIDNQVNLRYPGATLATGYSDRPSVDEYHRVQN